LKRLSEDAYQEVRRAVALNPKTPLELLENLAQDSRHRVRLAVAQNPVATSAVLEYLLWDDFAQVQIQVARAARVTPKQLEDLAGSPNPQVRRAAAQNSKLAPSVLEHYRKLGSGPLLQGYGKPDLSLKPTDLDRWVNESWWAYELVLKHPNTSSETLKHLAENLDLDEVRFASLIAVHPNTSLDVLGRLLEIFRQPAFKTALSSNPKARAILTLWEPNYAIRDPKARQILESQTTPVQRLEPLVQHPEGRVRERLTRHPNVTPDLLDKLARDRFLEVRINVLLNDKTSTATLERLSTDASVTIRSGVAHNPSISKATLERLAHDPQPQVRAEILKVLDHSPSRSLFPEIEDKLSAVQKRISLIERPVLERLAMDPSEKVRQAVAEFAGTPPEILSVLLEDEYPNVRRAASKNPHTLKTQIALLLRAGSGTNFYRFSRIRSDEMARDLEGFKKGGYWRQVLVTRDPDIDLVWLLAKSRSEDSVFRAAAASNPSLPLERLNALAHDESDWIREEVALSRVTPEATLTELARDSEPDVRAAVAGNIATSSKLLGRLVQDKERDVRRAARANVKTPRAVLSLLEKAGYREDDMNEVPNPNLSQAELAALADGWWVGERLAASHPQVSIPLLEQLSISGYAETRAAVAANRKRTPAALLNELSEDDESQVRSAVAANHKAPVTTLERLSRDLDEVVRRAVAGNTGTPLVVLERLVKDGQESVQDAAAQNIALPSSALLKLSSSSMLGVRKGLAQNPRTPLKVLEKLALDADDYVRVYTALNPNASAALRFRLKKDSCLGVREAATDPKNFSLELIGVDDDRGLCYTYEGD